MTINSVICEKCNNICSRKDIYCPKCFTRLNRQKQTSSSVPKNNVKENLVTNPKNEIENLNTKGISLLYHKNFSEALNNFQRALTLSEQIQDQRLKAISIFNIGEAIINQGKLEEGLDNYKKALNILEQLGDEKMISHVSIATGNVYLMQEKSEEGLQMLQNGIKGIERVGNINTKLNVFYNMGTVQFKLGKYQYALESFETALTIANNLQDTDIKRRTQANIILTRNKLK